MSMPENIENTEELVNTIKGQIADKEKEIQENFTKLGEVYYVKYAKDPDGDFSELCQEIENQYQVASKKLLSWYLVNLFTLS